MRAIRFFPLQSVIMKILLDFSSVVTELLIWWWAGWAKSFTGCVWLCYMATNYPWTRRFIGRSELTTLKITTYNTFLDVARDRFWLTYGWDFRLSNNNVIKFRNGSEIVLIDMKLYPNKDPNFDKLWSTEFTGWFLDEVNQIVWKGYQVISSRVWRYKNDHYGIRGLILMSCNPAKNRVYKEFYRKQKEWKIEEHKMFIQVLAKDNPNIARSYIERLSRLPNGAMKERLYYGNREYDDTPWVLFWYEEIVWMIGRHITKQIKEEKYIIVDVARHGTDLTTCVYREWLNWTLLRCESQSNMNTLQSRIQQEALIRWVRVENIIVDEDWVWWWLVDWLWCTWFLNNGAVVWDEDEEEKPNYQNLKTQCYYLLAKMMTEWKIWLTIPDYVSDLADPDGWFYRTDLEEIIHDELSAIKEEDIDKDWKRKITQKKDIKEQLGRSPDRADNLMMRMLPLLKITDDMSWAKK